MMTSGAQKKALAGVRVIEWAELVAGPYCAKLLADLGAEIIKIEPPGSGDEARKRGPFPNDIPHPEKSALFLYLNTNKFGISLDPESPTGKEVFKRLVKEADILVHDKAPQRIAWLGLDYETLREINPRLIMVSVTPFGQTGPHADWKAYPLNIVHA
ncbi:MAG: CoA transferase, partial [Chloroflexi bacterium]|nr:CoA transferase [Chloroflexota bacterium]